MPLEALILAALAGAPSVPKGAAFEAEDVTRLPSGGLLPDERASGALFLRLEPADKPARMDLPVDGGKYFIAARLKGEGTLVVKCDGAEVVLAASGDEWSWAASAEKIELPKRRVKVEMLARGGPVAVDQLAFVEAPPRGGAPLPSTCSLPDVLFRDDFTREKLGEEWAAVRGSWEIERYSDVDRNDPSRSANAFRLAAKGPDAVLAAGREWWRDYVARVSVLSSAPAGLCVFAGADGSGYYFLTDPGSGETRFEARTAERTELLAREPRAPSGKQWHALEVRALSGSLACSVDGREIFRVRDARFTRGRAGVWAGGPEARFDDFELTGVHVWRTAFDAELSGFADGDGWTAESGRVLRKGGGRLLALKTPPGEWGELAAVVRPAGGSAGLAFGVISEENYFVAHVGRSLVVERRRCGEREVVARKPLEGRPPWELRVVRDELGARVMVDGRELARVEGVWGAGGMGLYAKGRAVLRRVELSTHAPRALALAVNRVFAGEDTMKDWARSAAEWERKGTVLSGGYPVVDCSLSLALKNAPFEIQLVPEDRALAPCVLGVSEEGAFVLRAAGRESRSSCKGELALVREGGLLRVECGGKVAAAIPDPSPLVRVKARVVLKDEAVPEGLSFSSPSLRDYTFSRAPVDWEMTGGIWRLFARWRCDPRWSWFGGLSDELACIWNRRGFRGDVALDYFACPQMFARGAPYYSHPGDFNSTICADGRDLSSGYSFVYGGWKGTRTALFRRDEVVAETHEILPPHTRDRNPPMMGPTGLHRRWFHVVLEYVGLPGGKARVRGYVDGRVACEYVDPEPLTGDRVALWTFDGSAMFARVRVVSDGSSGPVAGLVGKAATPPAEGKAEGVVEGACPLSDFERDTGSWRAVKGSTLLRLAKDPERGHVLDVVNARSGGTFEAVAYEGKLDLRLCPAVEFRYNFGPSVKLDIYARIDGRDCHLGFTAGEETPDAFEPLGRVQDARADGRWHRARIGLLERLRDAGLEGRHLERLAFAAYSREGYLRAGIGGNPAGATFRVDDFSFPLQGSAVGLALKLREERDYAAIDAGGRMLRSGRAKGQLALAQLARKGTLRFGAESYAFRFDVEAPAMVKVVPTEGGLIGDEDVAFTVEETGSGLDPSSVRVECGGKALTLGKGIERTAAGASAGLGTGASFRFELARLGGFRHGKHVTLTFGPFRDLVGNESEPVELTWEYSRARDGRGPRLTLVSSQAMPLYAESFESPDHGWSGEPSLKVDRTTAHAGRASLRVVNKHFGSQMNFSRALSFAAGEAPFLSFAYKVGPDARLDFCLRAAEGAGWKRRGVRFTDNDGADLAGELEGIERDGEWHVARANLYKLVLSRDPRAHSYEAASIGFGGSGWPGNDERARLWIDEVRIGRIVRLSGESLAVRLEALDASGVKEIRCEEKGRPLATGAGPELSIPLGGSGEHDLVFRAVDSAGNEGEPLRHTVVLDEDAPELSGLSPPPDSRSAPGSIGCSLVDGVSGVDPRRLRLKVAGEEYRPGTKLSYDGAAGKLVWDALAGLKPVVFPDKARIDCVLRAADHVGNSLERSWSWTMDYSRDKTPPSEVYASIFHPKALVRDRYEGSKGGGTPHSGYHAASWRIATDRSATGRGSLLLENARRRSHFYFDLSKDTFDPGRYPVVEFDYLVKKRSWLDIGLNTDRGWVLIEFDGDGAGPRRLGKASSTTDGRWHRMSFDLASALKKLFGTAPRVRTVRLGSWSRKTTGGEKIWLDNFTVRPRYDERKRHVEFGCAPDATGARFLAAVSTKKTDPLPGGEGVRETAERIEFDLPQEWLSVRARDGAGNLGRVNSFKLE